MALCFVVGRDADEFDVGSVSDEGGGPRANSLNLSPLPGGLGGEE